MFAWRNKALFRSWFLSQEGMLGRLLGKHLGYSALKRNEKAQMGFLMSETEQENAIPRHCLHAPNSCSPWTRLDWTKANPCEMWRLLHPQHQVCPSMDLLLLLCSALPDFSFYKSEPGQMRLQKIPGWSQFLQSVSILLAAWAQQHFPGHSPWAGFTNPKHIQNHGHRLWQSLALFSESLSSQN